MQDQFGDKLKQLREDYNWTQEEFAEKLDVSRQSVYKWETHKGYPSIEKLIIISELFDVTIDELIKSDYKLQRRISVDENKVTEKLSDPGFHLGIIFLLIGTFIFDSNWFFPLMLIALFCIVFLDDFIQSIKSYF